MKKLLVVEDEEMLREVYGLLLKPMGYEIVEEASGYAAIERLENGETFDAIISDLSMPDGNGLTVRDAAVVRNIPVLLLSGHITTYNQFFREGEVCMAKPFVMAEFLDTVATLAGVAK